MQGNQTSQAHLNRRRCFKKCAPCRKSHKLCEPQLRDWERSKEKCTRCRRTNQACGPSVEALRRAPRFGGSPATSVNMVHSSQSFAEPEIHSDTMPSIMLEWWESKDIQIQHALECVLATQQVMWKKYVTLRKYSQKAPISSQLVLLQRLLSSIYSWLLAESRRIAAIGTFSLMTMTLDEQKSWLTLAFLQVASSRSLPMFDQPTPAGLLLQDLQSGIHPNWWTAMDNLHPDRVRIFASVAQMNTEPSSGVSSEESLLPHRGELAQRLHDYHMCESRVRTVMCSMPPGIWETSEFVASVHMRSSSPFPASHLAYLNGDLAAALKLWIQSESRDQDADIAGMTLAHLIVADHNLNFFRKMWEHDPQMSHILSRDCLGLNLLQTAAILNHPDCVSVLRGQGVRTDSAQQLFNIAVDSNSPAMVKAMIRTKAIQPPFTLHAKRAIVKGYSDVVRALYETLKLYEYHSARDLAMLVALAQQHGHHDLVTELGGLEQAWATPVQGREDLADVRQSLHEGTSLWT